jgi:hypothetical protein
MRFSNSSGPIARESLCITNIIVYMVYCLVFGHVYKTSQDIHNDVLACVLNTYLERYIWCFHSGVIDNSSLLIYEVVTIGKYLRACRRSFRPLFSWYNSPRRDASWTISGSRRCVRKLILMYCLNPEDGSSKLCPTRRNCYQSIRLQFSSSVDNPWLKVYLYPFSIH